MEPEPAVADIAIAATTAALRPESASPRSAGRRSVPMVPALARALDRLSQRGRFTGRDDFVFVGEQGEALDGSALRRRYAAAQKRAGLRSLRFHDLRHSLGTVAANAALNGRELQEWMGHADYRTTSRYRHYRSRGDEAARLAVAFAPAPRVEEAVKADLGHSIVKDGSIATDTPSR